MEKLTRDRFIELAKRRPGQLSEVEFMETPEGKAILEKLEAIDRQWAAERRQLTDGEVGEDVWLELYEMTGIDVLTISQMGAEDVQRLVQAANRKRAKDLSQNQHKVDESKFRQKQSKPPLTQNDRAILQAMLELAATSDNPQSSDVILPAALGDVDPSKAFKRLKRAGYVGAKRGIGRWLTESGLDAARRLTAT